ncbi:hypothetical protein VTO42DRAFT_2146 [Malbranchea cinnamomea]
MPNFMCPGQGYVPKLSSKFGSWSQTAKMSIINTFGFGYFIRSGLLRGISELTNANFAFIPDSGMLEPYLFTLWQICTPYTLHRQN